VSEQPRVPRGVSTGGQFAHALRGEADVSLTLPAAVGTGDLVHHLTLAASRTAQSRDPRDGSVARARARAILEAADLGERLPETDLRDKAWQAYRCAALPGAGNDLPAQVMYARARGLLDADLWRTDLAQGRAPLDGPQHEDRVERAMQEMAELAAALRHRQVAAELATRARARDKFASRLGGAPHIYPA